MGTSAKVEGGVHLCKRTGIASMVTDASIWKQVQVGGGSTWTFSSGCFYFLREVGSETTIRGRRNRGVGGWRRKEKVKITVEEAESAQHWGKAEAGVFNTECLKI